MKSLRKYFLQASLFALFMFAFFSSINVVFAQYIVCDDGDACYKQWGSAWRYYPYIASHGGDYYYLSHWDDGTSRLGMAKWETRIPTSGTYQVKISYRASANRGNATYFVTTGNMPNNMSLMRRTISQTGGCAPGAEGCGGCREFVVYTGQYTEGQKAFVVLDGTFPDGPGGTSNDSDSADAVSWRRIDGANVSPPEDLCQI